MAAMPIAIGMMCVSDILIVLFSGPEFISGKSGRKDPLCKVSVWCD